LSLVELGKTLQLDKETKKDLKRALDKLLKEGTIARVRGNRYVISKEADLVSGTIRFRASGAALLIPDDPQQEAIPIKAEHTATALNHDRVLTRLRKDRPKRYQRGKRGKSNQAPSVISAEVLRTLERKRTSLTGTLRKKRSVFYVIPDDPCIPYDILVEDPKYSTLKPRPKVDNKVIVQLDEWEHRHLGPTGVITETLGTTHSPGAEYQAILHKYDLDPNFPDRVEKEVRAFPDKVRKQDLKGREDCRKLFTLTVDPTDAKDFDDALSLEILPNGEHRIGIHIADVSSYVKPKSALDKEGQSRGNSTYLVGTVIPMLPHALSSGLCSLVEAEDRLTKTAFLTFNKNNKLIKTEFANTVIHSNKRLTYTQALAFLKEKDLKKISKLPAPPAHQTGFAGRPLKDLSLKELGKIQSTLKTLWSIASTLRRARMKKGSLDLDMAEVKIFVDEQGYADRIVRVEGDESHQMIEEFMLAANEAIAEALHKAGLPFISRVHDKPDAEKLSELSDTLEIFGIHVGDLTSRKAVTEFLKQAKNHPQAYTLKLHFLRSLKQACYRAEADGHYGLNKIYYAHFTSPIRRYSDLIVHRIFDFYLKKHGHPTAPPKPPIVYPKSQQESLAKHLSVTERNSTDAERESVKIKLLEFFEREAKKKTKTTFEAVIVDIKSHGIFVELTNSMAFGLIPTSSLRHDFFTLSTDGTKLTGKRFGQTFVLGQTVSVKVKSVDRFKRQMDFSLVAEKPYKKKQ
tara:strand:- start:14293 stop:16521 length:2229 start_codon:yes stop_codon:yes gene_type:complete